PRGLDTLCGRLGDASHLPEPEANSWAVRTVLRVRLGLERRVPFTPVDVDGEDDDAVLLRILQDRARRVETHGLAIDERQSERRGMMHLEPGARINEE